MGPLFGGLHFPVPETDLDNGRDIFAGDNIFFQHTGPLQHGYQLSHVPGPIMVVVVLETDRMCGPYVWEEFPYVWEQSPYIRQHFPDIP